MTRLNWTGTGKRFFETGIDRGVLYVGALAGVPWTGLTAVTHKPSGGETTPYYTEGVKYLNVAKSTDFEATIEAFTYPDEFMACEGSSALNGLRFTLQPVVPFGLSYRTKVGNDTVGMDLGYKVHIIYNALTKPADREFQTVADTTSVVNFSWDITTTAPAISGKKPTAHLSISSKDTTTARMASLENILYGTVSTAPRLPQPDELIALFTLSNVYDSATYDISTYG